MKIAFASKEGIYVNEHFGWAMSFYLYEITKEGYTFLKVLDSSKKIEEEINKLIYKIESLEDAKVVYVSQIGPKASQMLKHSGKFAMQSTQEGESIAEVLEKIQMLITTNPPLWLQRALLGD